MQKRHITPEKEVLAHKVGVLIDYLRRNRYRQKQWSSDINMPIAVISRSQNSATLRINEAEEVLARTCKKLNLEILPLHDTYMIKLRVAESPNAETSKMKKANWMLYFSGLYVGYIVLVREQRVATLFFLRLPNGKLQIRTETGSELNINRTLHGNWTLINENRTILDKIEPLPNEEGYRVQQYLEATFRHDDTLVGTYSGFSMRDMKPIGGAVMLKKINDWVGTEEQMFLLFQEKAAKDRSLVSHEDTTRLLKMEPQLLDFFMGNNDYDLRIESSQLFRNVGLLPLAPANMLSVAGCYYSYRLSIGRDVVYGNPFVIYSDGRVHMKRTDAEGFYEEYRGFATFDNGFLSVHIDRKINNTNAKPHPLQLHFVYNLANFTHSDLEYAFGTATMMTMFNVPRAAEEVLVVLKDKDLKQLNPRQIELANPQEITLLERKIVDYLQKKPISVADKVPNSPF